MKGGGLRVTYAAQQEPGFAPPKPRRPVPGSKGDGAEIISGCLPGQAVGLPALRLGKPCARVGIEWREMERNQMGRRRKESEVWMGRGFDSVRTETCGDVCQYRLCCVFSHIVLYVFPHFQSAASSGSLFLCLLCFSISTASLPPLQTLVRCVLSVKYFLLATSKT